MWPRRKTKALIKADSRKQQASSHSGSLSCGLRGPAALSLHPPPPRHRLQTWGPAQETPSQQATGSGVPTMSPRVPQCLCHQPAHSISVWVGREGGVPSDLRAHCPHLAPPWAPWCPTWHHPTGNTMSLQQGWTRPGPDSSEACHPRRGPSPGMFPAPALAGEAELTLAMWPCPCCQVLAPGPGILGSAYAPGNLGMRPGLSFSLLVHWAHTLPNLLQRDAPGPRVPFHKQVSARQTRAREPGRTGTGAFSCSHCVTNP